MTGLILAALVGLVSAVACWVVLYVSSQSRAYRLLLVFMAGFLSLSALHWIVPPDLGFLSPAFMMPIRWVDIVFSLLLYVAGFFGGLLQVYNLADRGFSLRIQIDILESPDGRMTLDDVMNEYSGGRGISWMYEKRLEGMAASSLIRRRNGAILMTERGIRAAKIFGFLRRLLHMAPPEFTDKRK